MVAAFLLAIWLLLCEGVLVAQVTAVEEMRKAVGRFGITGKTQTQPMAQLSDGLRSRVVFAWLARPVVCLFDIICRLCYWMLSPSPLQWPALARRLRLAGAHCCLLVVDKRRTRSCVSPRCQAETAAYCQVRWDRLCLNCM